MNEDYVSYELAVKLKPCGFDEPCIAQWACEPDGKPMLLGSTAFVFSNAELKGRDVTAPLLYQAQKWLREKKGIAINVDAHDGDFYTWEAVFLSNAAQDALIEASLSAKFSPYVEKHGSYERALSNGITAALELIKKGE